MSKWIKSTANITTDGDFSVVIRRESKHGCNVVPDFKTSKKKKKKGLTYQPRHKDWKTTGSLTCKYGRLKHRTSCLQRAHRKFTTGTLRT